MVLRSGEIYFSEQGNSVVLPETISLFGFSISFFGIFLVLAALIGIIAVLRETNRRKQNTEWNLTLLTLVIVSAVLGARIYYVLFEWHVFVENPKMLLNFRSGGLGYFGALFGAWFAVKWYCRHKAMDFAQCADTLCMGAAAAAPFIWCGCAFVREPLGRMYDGLFSICIGTDYIPERMNAVYADDLMTNIRRIHTETYVSIHPVAVYGVILSVVILIVLCFYKHFTMQSGAVFTMYLLLNSVMSIVLELFRADRYYIWGTKVPVNFVASGVIILIIIAGWVRQWLRFRKNKAKVKL